MNLTELPEEILVILIKKLDLKSIYHLYETCTRLKNVICMYNVVKTCSMKLNTMATAQTFNLQFIKDISENLQELDVRGVMDITKRSLLFAVKRMKCLKTLDVSYTNISIVDLYEVYKICPTIKNLSCNFVFGKDAPIRLSEQELIESQEFFKNFENINFIGNAANLMYTNLALWVVQKAKLTDLRFIVAENHTTVYQINDEIEDDTEVPSFKSLEVYVLNDWRMSNPSLGSLCVPHALTDPSSKNKFEFIAIVMIDVGTHSVYVSSGFEKFIDNTFEIVSNCVTDVSHVNYVGNSVILLWNHAETTFDTEFYAKLKMKLLTFFPFCKLEFAPPNQIDNYYFRVLPEKPEPSSASENSPEFKRKRIGTKAHVLDYDHAVDQNERIRLVLFFLDCITCPIALSTKSHVLNKLTYLSLNGNLHYGKHFFNVVFLHCKKLETLNVETPSSIDCIPSLAKNISFSCSLKHFRLLDKRIDCKLLFPALAKCVSLENLHLVDMSRENNDLADPTIIVEKCENLYYVFIHASMSQSAKTKKYQVFKKLKDQLNKPYLYVLLSCMYGESNYKYDPYIDVFRLNPIRPYE